MLRHGSGSAPATPGLGSTLDSGDAGSAPTTSWVAEAAARRSGAGGSARDTAHNAETTSATFRFDDLTTDQPGMLVSRRLDRGELALLCRNELVDVLVGIERLANRLAGYRAEVLGALDELSRSGIAPDPTPHLTLRDATNVSDREARRLLRVARKAREHDAVLDVLAAGDINAEQAEALCDARVPDEVRTELVVAAAAHAGATRRRHARVRAGRDHPQRARRRRGRPSSCTPMSGRTRLARRAGYRAHGSGFVTVEAHNSAWHFEG